MKGLTRGWALPVSLGAALAMAAFSAETAHAGTIKVQRDTSNYTGTIGGEFKVVTFTGGSFAEPGTDVKVGDAPFQTFCLEKNEDISSNTLYDWKSNTSAVLGGVGGAVNGADPLDAKTAYLYHKFYTGTLSDYDYDLGSGRLESSDELQNAIWYIEGEISSLDEDSQAQTWYDEAVTATSEGGSWFGKGLGNVRVLNVTLTGDDGNVVNKQDLLYIVPLPPAALAGLALMGAMGAARLRRRFKS